MVVSLPAEIDIANAEHVGEQLRAAFAPGVTNVTAKMGLTVFRSAFGRRQLAVAHKRAMSWLANPRPEIGDCRLSNHVRRNSGGPLWSQPALVLAVGR